jgi:hypothetical protein
VPFDEVDLRARVQRALVAVDVGRKADRADRDQVAVWIALFPVACQILGPWDPDPLRNLAVPFGLIDEIDGQQVAGVAVTIEQIAELALARGAQMASNSRATFSSNRPNLGSMQPGCRWSGALSDLQSAKMKTRSVFIPFAAMYAT